MFKITLIATLIVAFALANEHQSLEMGVWTPGTIEINNYEDSKYMYFQFEYTEADFQEGADLTFAAKLDEFYYADIAMFISTKHSEPASYKDAEYICDEFG